jgi:ATP synthase subunit 6
MKINNTLFFICDPLEQFDFLPLVTIFNFTLINNLVVYCFFIAVAISILFIQANYKVASLTNLGLVNKKLFNFIKTIVKENVALVAQKYFPIIYYIFLFLLFCNMLGMVPYSFTITSSFTVTLFLSLGFFIGVNIIGCLTHGIFIFKLFLPNGAPLVIMPALIIIEFLSYFARIFSLSIRLFANMMSGHTLLKILAGFAYSMLQCNFFPIHIAFFIPLIIVFLVTGLELAIAFLQAYVFTVLICIYLNDVFSFH